MITDIFGIPIKYEKWNKENSLPLYIVGSYDFKAAIIDTQRCIMLTVKEELAAIPSLKQQIKRIQEVDMKSLGIRGGNKDKMIEMLFQCYDIE